MRHIPGAAADRRLVFILVLLFFFSARGYLQVSDTLYSLKTAEAIVSSGRLDIPDGGTATLRAPGGRRYSKYGIGLPLLFVPLVAAGHAAVSVTGLPRGEIIGFMLSFVSVPFAALTIMVFSLLLQHFAVKPRDRWLLMAGLGMGSLCWRYAGYDFSEAMQMGLLLLAVYGAIRGTSRSLLAAGAGFAGLILVKLVHVVLLPVFLGYLLARSGTVPQRIRQLSLFMALIALGLCVLGSLNLIRFGNPLESGYGSEAGMFFPSQLPRTIPRLLGSFDEGLLVFCPVIFLGLLGWPQFIKQHAREAALCGTIVLSELALAGSWHAWAGGWSWGPRLLVPSIPLWLLPAAFWLDRQQSTAAFGFAVAVTALSVAVQVPGVLVRDQEIHEIKQNRLTPEELEAAPSDVRAANILLWHKLTSDAEVYRTADFGIPTDRELDLTAFSTFEGIDVWTEHLARYAHRPVLRWLPGPAFLLAVWLSRLFFSASTRKVGAPALPGVL